jgi:hypothetical protein
MSRTARYHDEISLAPWNCRTEAHHGSEIIKETLAASFVSFQITSPRHRFHLSEGQTNSRAFLLTSPIHFHRVVANPPF